MQNKNTVFKRLNQLKNYPKLSGTAGLPPGEPVHVGIPQAKPVELVLLTCDRRGKVEETTLPSLDDLPAPRRWVADKLTWLDLDGVHEVESIQRVGQLLELHPLVVEDILNTTQRPKVENYGEYLYIVLKLLKWDDTLEEVQAHQLNILLGKDYVVTFQEYRQDVFDALRLRLQEGKGRTDKLGAGYLVYALLDVVVDHYYVVLDKLGERLEDLEEEVIGNPQRSSMQNIHRLKSELRFLRKTVWPLREMLNQLVRDEERFFGKETELYLRDVYDHIIQVMDMVETYRDIASGMVDTYLSSLSNQMNAIMKVLTIISTLFIPLTFITGLYGMNFEYMPELSWRWGYFAVLGVMVLLLGAMLVYFRRNKWL